jgi:hypothetical protein
MLTIQRTNKLIVNAEATLKKYEPSLIEQPNNLFFKGIVKNTREELDELKRNLALQKSYRDKEIIDFRLIGPSAKVGSLPIEVFGEIITSFGSFFQHTSAFIAYGKNSNKKKFSNLIKNQIDLRLDRILPGSTHLILSAKTAPNLFGESAAENGLEQTFKLLNVETPESFLEEASNVGSEGLKNFKKMLSVGVYNDLEMNISWESPNNKKHAWNGEKDKLNQLLSIISQIKKEKPEFLDIEGEIRMLYQKGKLEILTNDYGRLQIKFPENLLDQVKEFRLGDLCNLKVQKNITVNTVTGKKKETFELVSF